MPSPDANSTFVMEPTDLEETFVVTEGDVKEALSEVPTRGRGRRAKVTGPEPTVTGKMDTFTKGRLGRGKQVTGEEATKQKRSKAVSSNSVEEDFDDAFSAISNGKLMSKIEACKPEFDMEMESVVNFVKNTSVGNRSSGRTRNVSTVKQEVSEEISEVQLKGKRRGRPKNVKKSNLEVIEEMGADPEISPTEKNQTKENLSNLGLVKPEKDEHISIGVTDDVDEQTTKSTIKRKANKRAKLAQSEDDVKNSDKMRKKTESEDQETEQAALNESEVVGNSAKVSNERKKTDNSEVADQGVQNACESPSKRKSNAVKDASREPKSDGESSTKEDDKDGEEIPKKRSRGGKKISADLDLKAKMLELSGTKEKKFVGAHVSIVGGLWKSVEEAVQHGARAFAIFLKNQRQWKSKPLDEQDAEKFASTLKAYGFSPSMVVPHGSYLMNCGSARTEILDKSRAMLIDELQRCVKLGLPIFNFHPGSTCGEISVEESIDLIAESINMALDQTTHVTVVIENMCCQGNTIGGRFSELGSIIERVEDKSRIGICFDTCHAFAAGYDIRTEEQYEKTMTQFDEDVGFKYLKAVHLNDSKGDLGCNLDRHENIGRGKLGLQTFRLIMNDPRFDNIPMILETPENDYMKEIKTLNKLITQT